MILPIFGKCSFNMGYSGRDAKMNEARAQTLPVSGDTIETILLWGLSKEWCSQYPQQGVPENHVQTRTIQREPVACGPKGTTDEAA